MSSGHDALKARPFESSPRMRHAAYGGVLAIAAASLMYEILLTRIFSVTMWYHFAFLAVAAALLGMTAGGLIVQFGRVPADPERLTRVLARSALAFAVAVPVTFLVHLTIPFSPTLTVSGLLSILLTYALVAIPFVFSGICLCAALTKLDGLVARVYAADFAGGAIGCLATLAALRIADAPSAMLLVATIGGAAATVFSIAARCSGLVAGALLTIVVTLGAVVTVPSWFRPTRIKGALEAGPTLYERWNTYSRIRVTGDPEAVSAPFGWGLSRVYPANRRVGQLLLSIDGVADTVLTRFDGNLAMLEHLRYDITNLAHYLRHNAGVLVVGAGGGRDILGALVFGQREITAVEVNDAILDALNGHFGDYTGHLNRQPSVRFVNDEARSYAARLHQRFDIIHVSFLDTFAATAAGAYVLAEHSLYTIEAWRTFLGHLSPSGILTYSRWYFHDNPAEIQRLVTLATTALLGTGVRHPAEHLILVRTRVGADPRYREAIGVGTLLVGREPFSSIDLNEIDAVTARLGFEIVLDPRRSRDPTLAALADPERLRDTVKASPLDISAPTDDRPFFFHTAPLSRVFRLETLDQGNVSFNTTALIVLAGGLVVVTVVVGAGLVVPLAARRWRSVATVRASEMFFFSAIGIGYILIELAQLQRLSLFLGHPTHGLVVVLFTLLLSSGTGSWAVRRKSPNRSSLSPVRPLLAVPTVLVVVGLLTPVVLGESRALETPARIAVAAALLVPCGFALGMAFPLGLELVLSRTPTAAPWLWAVNTAASVVGSLAATVVSISVGVSVTFWAGVGAYLVAVAAGLRMGKSARVEPAVLVNRCCREGS